MFRSYSQDFVPHNQASVQPFLPSASSSSPHFPPVHQSQSSDLAVPITASPPPGTVDGPLSSSQESTFHGNTVCLPSETSLTDSPQTPSVRTRRTRPVCGCACDSPSLFARPSPATGRSGWRVPLRGMATCRSVAGHKGTHSPLCTKFPTN